MRSNQDDVAYITGSVLEWARRRSGLALDAISQKIHVAPKQITDWESGASHPPFKTAQELARILRVPFGLLFLPAPPPDDLPLPDFRTLEKNYLPTPDFLALLNDTLVKQDWYRDYLSERATEPLRFVGKYGIDSNVADVAANIRRVIGIDQSLRQSVRSWAEYLSALGRNIEEAGILVMRSSVVGNTSTRKILPQEVQGFAIADNKAPLIFVNSADFKASQIFTTAHELAHVWIGQSAISNPDEIEIGRHWIEAFCNKVAAETLVPEEEFLSVWDEANGTDIAISKIARWFLVSSLVVLRRAYEFDRISHSQFQQLKKIEMSKQNRQKGGGGDYYRNVVARMGGRLTYAVVSEVKHQRILLRDASRLLDMKVPTLLKFANSSPSR